jgi:SAM-dependent methyltransferase
MTSTHSPLFCLTSDVDWASEFAIDAFLALVGEFGVRPTIFATHTSARLDAALASGAAEVGIHPNLLPGSTHGTDVASVVDHLCGLFPAARTFRAHAFRDDTHLTDELVRRGFVYDSNLCLYLQPDLTPLCHQSGLVRFPVFWEDDVHYRNTGGDWSVEKYLPAFTTPGLKVLNVHPFMVAANVPNAEYYRSVKAYIPTLGPENIDRVRFDGEGVGTFLRRLLEALTARRERFYTLGDLHRMWTVPDPLATADENRGRQTVRGEDDMHAYPSMSDAEKQAFVRREFEERNARDPYATSRDYNMRELEIAAIGRELSAPGDVLDLGCGNGHTLLSLATGRSGWRMTGVDFSTSLVAGAHALLAERAPSLESEVSFLQADAIAHMASLPPASVDYVITERFMQNLPSRESQWSAIRDAYRVLAPGGRLLMCEGSETSFERLNDLREAVGLDRIPLTTRENITAIRFHDDEVERHLSDVGFVLARKLGFSIYFMMARVLHPLLVAPHSPRFDARLNDLAGLIQHHAPFDPGYGGNVLWVCEKPA